MEYAKNFEGLGCLATPVHDVTSFQMPIHRIPVAKRVAEKSALNKYENVGILTKVDDPTKANFARLGIPQMCQTDNGSQFASKGYENFATQYGFNHTTSSPYHPKGNARAEAAVKVAKTTLKKSTDFQSALLNFRNTPLQGHTYLPAHHMLC